MAPTNGVRTMLTQITISVGAAVVLSVGAAFVSVKVMSTDLDRAKADIAELDRTNRTQAIELAQMRAATTAGERQDDDRWAEVKSRLGLIEADVKELLLRTARRDSTRNR